MKIRIHYQGNDYTVNKVDLKDGIPYLDLDALDVQLINARPPVKHDDEDELSFTSQHPELMDEFSEQTWRKFNSL
jgi:hypothetical protein